MHRFDRTPLIRTLPFIAAGLASLIAAAVAATAPIAWMASATRMTGAAAVVPLLATTPGLTGAAMIVVALLTAGFVWSSLYLLFGHGGMLVRKGRRARAAVWGAGLEPFPEEERRLPRDLDQPLSAFDPDALPVVPLQAVRVSTPPQRCAPASVSGQESATIIDITTATSAGRAESAEPPVDVLPISGLRSPEPSRPSEDAITYLRSVDLSASLSSFGKRNAAPSPVHEPDLPDAAAGEPSIAALLARLERGAAGMKQG